LRLQLLSDIFFGDRGFISLEVMAAYSNKLNGRHEDSANFTFLAKDQVQPVGNGAGRL
jgi:hypothetical protein